MSICALEYLYAKLLFFLVTLHPEGYTGDVYCCCCQCCLLQTHWQTLIQHHTPAFLQHPRLCAEQLQGHYLQLQQLLSYARAFAWLSHESTNNT
jgi:hypothetical protein